MKLSNILIFFIVILFSASSIKAELPYESEHEHSFVVTRGIKSWKPLHSDSQNIFSLNYNYKNKFSVGLSKRYSKYVSYIYEGFGVGDNTGFLETDDGVILSGTDGAAFNTYYYQEDYYYNLFAQINPFKILQIEIPISFSMLVAVQDVSHVNNFVAIGHLYKMFTLKKKHTIQPTFSIGYRDISRHSNRRLRKIGGALLYSYKLNDMISFLIIPQVNRYIRTNDYSLQAGISYSL